MINTQKIADNVSTKARRGTKILLQLPEGLKTRAIEIIDSLKSNGFDIVLSNDPCFGACDIRDKEAQAVGAQLIVHLGHKRFYKELKSQIPVLYIPLELDAGYDKKELEKIKEPLVGIVSTVNYSYLLPQVEKDLRAIDKTPSIGGEILGCNAEKAKAIEEKVNCFIFIGTGRFHPLGIRTSLPVYFFDLEKNRVELIEKKEYDRITRINYAKLEKFRDSKTVGILLSSKHGQFYPDYESLKKRVEKTGKKAYIFVMDCINNEKLMGLKIDFFINTACPRIAEDNFSKPVMNASDFLQFYG